MSKGQSRAVGTNFFAADSLRALYFQLYLYFSCKKRSGEINAKGFRDMGNK